MPVAKLTKSRGTLAELATMVSGVMLEMKDARYLRMRRMMCQQPTCHHACEWLQLWAVQTRFSPLRVSPSAEVRAVKHVARRCHATVDEAQGPVMLRTTRLVQS